MKQNHFLISILLVVLAAFLLSKFTLPMYNEIKEERSHLVSLDETLGNSELLQVLKDEKYTLYNNILPSKSRTIENAIPAHTSENIVLMHLALNQVVATSGLPRDTSYLVGQSRVDTINGLSVVRVPITFTLGQLNYSTVMRFLAQLGAWERGVVINEVVISDSASNPGATNAVRAVVNTEVLFLNTDTL